MKRTLLHGFFITFIILLVLFHLSISILYLLYLQSRNSSTLGDIIATILYLLYIISIFLFYRKTIKINPTFEQSKDIKNLLNPKEEYKILSRSYTLRLMENVVLFLLIEFLIFVVFFTIKIQFT